MKKDGKSYVNYNRYGENTQKKKTVMCSDGEVRNIRK